jgi:hypothetical protein
MTDQMYPAKGCAFQTLRMVAWNEALEPAVIKSFENGMEDKNFRPEENRKLGRL